MIDEQEQLIRDFLACCVRPEFFKDLSLKRLAELDPEKHMLSAADMFLGAAKKRVRAKPKSTIVLQFLDQTKKGYLSCAKYLLKKMPITNAFLRAAQALDPACRGHTVVIKRLNSLGDLLSVVLTKEEQVEYSREVRGYNIDNKLHIQHEQLDLWWAAVEKSGKYHASAKVALASASCFHGPQVEAAFSSVGNILDENAASMKIETYSSIQTVRYYLMSCKKRSHHNSSQQTVVQ